ncbi:MAG: hypothetical protein PHZ09_10680 [Eubacteriales bacterium]|nr:hypothetical protein [Eubacteriales bacterium]
MLYVLYRYEYEHPGLGTEAFSFVIFDSKRDFLNHLIKTVKINARTLSYRDDDEAVNKAGKVLKELKSIHKNKYIESKSLAGREWTYGPFHIKICFAEYYPKALEGFRESVLEVVDVFKKYAGLDGDGKQDEDDGFYELYKAFDKIDENSTRKEFNETFTMLMDGFVYEDVF